MYAFPELLDSRGDILPYTVTFDELTSEFALYDPESLYLWAFNWLLRDQHEGRHTATVSVTYGEGEYEQTMTKEMFIDVNCVPDEPEVDTANPVDEPVVTPVEKPK